LAYLQFEGVMGAVEVYVNGHFVASKIASYTPLRYEISDLLATGGGNVIAVRVDGSDTDSWWYDGAGIYRTASITFTPAIHLAQYGVYAPALVQGEIVPETDDTPATAECTLPANIEVECASSTSCAGSKVSLHVSVFEASSSSIVSQTSVDEVLEGDLTTISLDVPLEGSTKLWSILHPSLYTMEVALVDLDRGIILDKTAVSFGCRRAEFDAESGFILNGVATKILGVANHQDLPGFGVAVPDTLQSHRVLKMQEFGANAWRTAHNCPSSSLLDATDEFGMLVWDENHKNGQTEEAVTLVRRDRNHPSVIIWSICNEALCNADGLGNESPGSMEAAQDIIDVYHSLDPLMNRPVSSNQNG
jgi:beta-galactosidase